MLFKEIKYWLRKKKSGLLTWFFSSTGKKQEADELGGDASVEDDAFVKVNVNYSD